ncbi:MAG: FIST C-terminal domain-containing protein [Myxococcales bacterium]|nr:FIST C-terminal domain-containing protein [Myxococcales bacterium]MCB9734871.1 FIST C-terminal domain-containing protein [Deltaproteobacteria bacterium]
MTTLHASHGFSIQPDEHAAVAEVVAGLRATDGPPPAVVIAYAGVAHDQARLLAALEAELPGVVVVGASTQGVSIPGRCYEADRFVAAAALGGEGVRARSAVAAGFAGDPYAAGVSLAAQLGPAEGPGVTLLWYDPLSGADVQATLRGLAAGGHPRVFGGASGQPWGRMVETFQYGGGRVMTDGAVALRVDGVLELSDFTHGAEPLGLELDVTRAEGNVVLELDGRPALDVWCEQLGVSAELDVENTSNWALGVKPPDDTPYEGVITRAPFGFDPARQALVLQAPIAEGSRVQVCIRTQRAVFDGAMRMTERLKARLDGHDPVLVVSFECGARPAPFLGSEVAEREVLNLQHHLGPGVPWLGMYAWGEIAPVGARSEFHNFTFPLCVLCAP